MIREATQLQRQNRVAEAIEAYRRILAHWPGEADSWFNLAVLQRRAQRPEDALDSYQKALDAGVARPEEAHLNRSVIYTDYLRQHATAERELHLALSLNPVFTPALLNLGNLCEDLGRRADALTLYARILDGEPRCFEALARYANLMPATQVTANLIAELRRALADPAASAAARASLGFALGRALDATAEYPAAFAAYRLYRNYDGNGGRFESTSVRATVVVPAPGPGDGLEAYAAVGPTRMTVVLVNESNVATTGTVAIGGFAAGPTAKWFASSGPMIVKQPDVPVQNGKATVTLAATSIGMLVVDGQWGIGMADGGVPDLAAGDAAMMATRDAATAAQDAAMMAAGDAATAARDAATGRAQDAASGAAALATSGPGDAAQAPVIPAAGCGCRVAARSTGGSTAWLVGLALLAMAARRQRDRASREWSMGAGSPRALR